MRTVATYTGFVIAATFTATSVGLLLNEFLRPSAYSNYVGFWSFASGLFGSVLILVSKHLFRPRD